MSPTIPQKLFRTPEIFNYKINPFSAEPENGFSIYLESEPPRDFDFVSLGALGELDALDEPDVSDDGLRLSVMYQPDPLKIIPAGEKIFRTRSDAHWGHWRIGASCTD